MSSILNALKKLEQEKVARRGNNQDITATILSNRRGRRKRWFIPASMAGVAVIAVLGTYLVMGHFYQLKREGQQVFPSTATLRIPPPLPITPIRSQQYQSEERRQSPLPPDTGTYRMKEKKKAPLEAASRRGAKKSGVLPQPAPNEKFVETLSAGSTIPKLTVSGIGWQKDSAGRLAVVNGVSVAQGATIDGVKVEEILPDRVRFVQGQHLIEVQLGNTSAPGGRE